MKVKSILALAAANLGREDLISAINECAGSPTGELRSLLRCYNLVENEIALDYFPLTREESVTAGRELPYSVLSRLPAEVREVRRSGVPVSFAARPDGLVFDRDAGHVTVIYDYVPGEKGCEDDCEVGGKVSARLLSFGVCSEFCLTTGRFSEAAAWEKKYRDALRAAEAPRRPFSVRARRWG